MRMVRVARMVRMMKVVRVVRGIDSGVHIAKCLFYTHMQYSKKVISMLDPICT
jgi:hypothetical protein